MTSAVALKPVDDLLTQLGIGEAFVTMLNEKGIPTPLVHTMLVPPRSRMDVLTDAEINNLVAQSKLASKYGKAVDSQSAYEILTAKMEEAAEKSKQEEDEKKDAKTKKAGKEESIFDNTVTRQAARTATSIITRGLLGALGLGGRSRSKKSTWF